MPLAVHQLSELHNALGRSFAIALSPPSYAYRLRGERMATTPQTVHEEHTGAPSALQEKARRHLWMHFTRMGAYDREHEIPIIVRGEGSYVYDEHDKRYLDGLSALFCVNAGHGRTEIGEAAARQVENMIEFQGPETVAAVILEPVQNSGGCFVPQDGYWQRVREICDRHGVLLIADEVICSWGRLGHWFGVERFGVVPNMITTAKGITSAYSPMGGVIVSDRVSEPFMSDTKNFTHGITFGGHPVSAAMALANLDIFEREDLCGHVREKEPELRRMLDKLHEDLPIVGDVRGAGYFHALELVKDKETKESFSAEEGEELLRGFMSGELYRHGLICRADDRGDPVIQLSPPLIADTEEFEIIDRVLRQVLTDAWDRIVRH